MQYRRVGRSGLQLSELSFGAWVTFGTQVGLPEAKQMLQLAFEQGVNFFDNAESYARGEAERIMGQALAELGLARDAFCVSSKAFFGSAQDPHPTQRGLSRKHMFEACHSALKRLQVDYLDLYYCHRPDPETPIDEIVWTMTQLIMAGKVLYWGTSEWSASALQAAIDCAERNRLIAPVVEQPQYNLLHRDRVEAEYEALLQNGLGLTTWSPLASGMLSGKHIGKLDAGSRFRLPGYEWLETATLGADPTQHQHSVERIQRLCQALGVSMSQFSIAWCLRNRKVSSVILGASRIEQLASNLKAPQLLASLTDNDWARAELTLLGLSR